jgi:hypothetical protein
VVGGYLTDAEKNDSQFCPYILHLKNPCQSRGFLQVSVAAHDDRGTYRAYLRLGEASVAHGNLQGAREYENRAYEKRRGHREGEAQPRLAGSRFIGRLPFSGPRQTCGHTGYIPNAHQRRRYKFGHRTRPTST